jgi:quinol-cytochrome oxidoreductase complex cytochrome b subunit
LAQTLSLDRPPELVKLLLSIAVLGLGLFLARYLFRSSRPAAKRGFEQFLGERPWRRLGGGIAVVLAVMFVVGIYAVDIPDRPVPYAIFWIIILGMVVWLCFLAVKDAVHTRRCYQRWKREERLSGFPPEA